MNSKTIRAVTDLNPCLEAIVWLKKQKSPQAAWRACERGDWMLWLLGKLSGEPGSDARRKLVLAACACARLSLEYVPKGEDRPRKTIETAEAWAKYRRGVTLDDVRKAVAAAYAAYAAAYAAYAADNAAKAAAYAADAADNAAYAAAKAAANANVRVETLAKCAVIVRKFYPRAPKLARNLTRRNRGAP